MSIEVTGPDGAIHEFPDGTTPDVIKGVMSKAYAPSQDKYKQAAIDEYNAAQRAGAPTTSNPIASSFTNGAMLGALPTVTAAMETPLEMVKRWTLNPVEAYNYAKAAEDLAMQKAREKSGVAGTAAGILGGISTAGEIAKKGYTLVKSGQEFIPRLGALAGEGAIYGGVTGFNEGDGSGRLADAAKGAALGGAVGAAIPLAWKAIASTSAPLVSNILARTDPQRAATARLVKALSESGKSTNEIASEVANANAAGQPMRLMDAMGSPGQELASTVARAPGDGRTALKEFLDARQAGQAGRVGDIIDQSLGAGQTAKQTISDLIQQGKDASKPLYEKAMQIAPVWDDRIQQFLDEPIMKQGLATGVKMQRLEALAEGRKFDPHDYAITDFDAAGSPILSGVPNMRTLQAAKIGLDELVDSHRNEFGNLTQMGRSIDMVRRSFLDKLNSYNPDYAAANAAFAGPAQVRDAVKYGQQAATRGRAADNLGVFNSLSPAPKQGFRTGYADALNQQIERGAEGQNAARRFTSEKYRAELPELSTFNGPYLPGQPDATTERLARELQMFETRSRALGGSKTADNLANAEDAGIDPRIFWNLMHGNVGAAASNVVGRAGNVLTGNTPAVRSELAKMLLAGGDSANLSPMLGQIESNLKANQALEASLMRAGVTGVVGGAADELIRKRSPLFAELQRNAPMIEQYPISRDALVRALLMSGDQTQ